MSSKDWRQWLKLTKKQLRQLGRTIDQELGNVLERHLPAQAGRMAKVPVPVRNQPVRFPVRNLGYRNFHQTARSGVNLGRQQLTRNISSPQKALKGGLTLFSSCSRVPRGSPRGLFTNWNMTSTRFAQGRMYSTASIKFTHEAVNNMSISLRCLFNSMEQFMPKDQGAHVLRKSPVSMQGCSARLSNREISLIREMEVFDMIAEHKTECPYTGSETLGAYVEFRMPTFDSEKIVPAVVFVNAAVLEDLEAEMARHTKSLQELQQAVRRIYENYGSLPMTFESGRLRIHFPNLTMMETEKLMVDLGVTVGCVHPDHATSGPIPLKDDNILSNANSYNDLSSVELNCSSVLSESCSSWNQYQLV